MKKKFNNRDRMRASNRLARIWMLENGYTWIWFKAHGKRKDWVFTPDGNYYWLDLWGLFDGLCMKGYHSGLTGWQIYRIVPFQIKTNKWASSKDIEKWLEDKDIWEVLSINVKGAKGKWSVHVRTYPPQKEDGVILS